MYCQVHLRAPSGSRLVLTALSRTSLPHVVRNAGQGSLGAPGRAPPARPGRPGRALTVSPGWRREGVPAGVAGATKNKPLSETYGRDITSSIFSSAFFSARARMRCGQGFFLRTRSQGRREVDLASLSSCYAGRGGKTRTEGLQYFEPMGNVLLAHPGNFSHCADTLPSSCGRAATLGPV